MAKLKNELKTGIRNIPTDRGFDAVHYYFGYSLDKKDLSKIFKQYLKKNYKKDYDAISANAEWNFTTYSGNVAAAYWIDQGQEFPEKYSGYPEFLKNFIDNLIVKGKGLLRTKAALDEVREEKKVYTPQQRLMMKIGNTILVDIDELEDQWINGEKTTLDIVSCMRIHELKGMAVGPVVQYLERLLPEYVDAHSGECKQAKEAYAHLGKRELSRRIKAINNMIEDLLKYKESQKSMRKKRKTK